MKIMNGELCMKAALNLIKLVFVFFLFLPLAHAANPVVEFETNQGNFKIELSLKRLQKQLLIFYIM